jgi:hypothetical protein
MLIAKITEWRMLKVPIFAMSTRHTLRTLECGVQFHVGMQLPSPLLIAAVNVERHQKLCR